MAAPAWLHLSFTDCLQGWGVDGRNRIWHTTDGGDTWAVVSKEPLGLPADEINFIDAEHGWITSLSTVWSANDGGNTWMPVDMPWSLSYGYFLDQKHAWVGAQPVRNQNNIL